MAATPADLRRATSADEAGRALAWAVEQAAIAARRVEALDGLRGDPAARVANYERWAALLPSPGDR